MVKVTIRYIKPQSNGQLSVETVVEKWEESFATVGPAIADALSGESVFVAIPLEKSVRFFRRESVQEVIVEDASGPMGIKA